MRIPVKALVVGLLMAGLPFDTAVAADCTSTYLPAQVPLTDLAGSSYQGEIGGLYPDGSNSLPAAHLALGERLAAEVLPRTENGQPSPSGKIGLVSIGVSNTAGEFNTFIRQGDTSRDSSVVVVNGAQGGEPISAWLSPTAQPWTVVYERLAGAGLSPSQVQVAWVKLPERNPSEAFPLDATTYADDLATVLRNLKTNFPNVKLAYLSSRIYAGYGTELNPEPWAYQHGFGVKWTIEAQIQGDSSLNADPAKGGAFSPWVAWGPYLWANGLGSDRQVGGIPGRSDGLEWLCSDFREDGIHPSNDGAVKVASMLLAFFHSDSTACGWYLTDPSTCGAPAEGSSPFTDIVGSPFESDITWLVEHGITNGCAPTKFCPTEPVTREQMAAFLRRALDLPAGPEVFDDDDGSFFEADINALAASGITNGCAPTRFCPKETVTREQMAAFLHRSESWLP